MLAHAATSATARSKTASSFTPAGSGLLQRKCACGGTPGPTGECEECRKKRLQRKTNQRSTRNAEPSVVPPIVHDVLRSPGQPLDAETRGFMEPRFGHDFSRVRVHTDAKAAESARAVHALAYTMGQEVVFGAGQYRPETAQGRRLLAHELTHTMQQERDVSNPPYSFAFGAAGDAYELEADGAAEKLAFGRNLAARLTTTRRAIQRACGPDEVEKKLSTARSDCVGVEGDIVGEHYLFRVNCDDFRPGQEALLRAFAATLSAGGSVKIHGFASIEGGSKFNDDLSCLRAIKVQQVLNDVLAPLGIYVSYNLFKHGATAGDREERRSAYIDWLPAGPEPSPAPKPTPPSVPACTPAAGIPNTVCSAYAAHSSWLPLAYVRNATCACNTTPNLPEYSCIRKFLQDRVAAAPPPLKTLAASKKYLEASINPLDLLEYKKFVLANLTPVIYKDHVDAYRGCCCPSGPAPYPAWEAVTTIPSPSCDLVGESIKYAGSCHGTPGKW
jgi:outer membrane protein OmpA-like peptidoglycan-associated protein